MMRFTLIASAALLAACTDAVTFGGPSASVGAPPIVRSTDRGTAMLTIIACPFTPTGGSIVAEMIRDLQTAAPIVTADARGTSRLVINTCASLPTAEMITAAAALQRRVR